MKCHNKQRQEYTNEIANVIKKIIMDAAGDVVIVAASDATVITTQKSTDAFNVNQSNNSAHTPSHAHTASNSLLSKIAGNVISNNSGSSLNIGGSSNSNSSCSSSSTSSNSSGYGSSTTTPTHNYDLQNTTPTTTPIPTTTVANTDHIIPVATVAAVTPFFNEAITTHNLETQHHHHHALQSQEQLQQQQHHRLQAHHQQYSQNHLPSNLQHQQHHQYLSRQQYYSPYDYQQSAPTHSLSGAPVAPTVAAYNMIIPGPYEMPTSNVTPAFASSQYKSAGSIVGSTYEQNLLVKTNVAACTQQLQQQQQQQQQQHVEQPQSKAINQHFSGLLGSAKPRSSSSFISNSANTNTSKPQATATPFYANPIPFYDNYKHKIPLEYPDAYSNSSPATTAAYHQQQKYYAAAKSQLKEAPYGSPAGLSSKSAYANTSGVFPGSTGGLNLSSASYDKYMYPHAPATGCTATGHLGNETPPEVSNYRKPALGSNMNSSSWPWGIEYASGNSRSIPPPSPSHLPTATVAPTHATHLTQNSSVLARDPFYMTHDKYVAKYDKYSTPSYPQTYVNPPTNRHMWSNTPHATNLSQFNERHLLASGPPALPTHGPHTAPYFSSNPNASLNNRQTCCSQPYQSQSCYYPVAHPAQPRLSHNQNNTVAPPLPPPTTGCLPGPQTLGQSPHLNALTASCKYSGIFSDYGNPNKMKTSTDLYLNSHHYDINPPAHSFGYPTAHNSQQIYNTNAHQSLAHGATPSSLLTNDPFNINPASYTNDLNLPTSNFDNYHTHLDNHPSQQTLTGIHNTQPPPTYGPTVAKRALLDYRKPIQPQPPPAIPEDCYPSLTPRDHYNQHELLNTPETTTTFEEYEVHQRNAIDQPTGVLSEESNKNLSLRDFIANWNDDEDEYQNNEEINFDQTAVINEVLQSAPIEPGEAVTDFVTIQDVKVIKPATQKVKDDETSKEIAKAVGGTSGPLNETEAGQYVNLPDIVIDVKKSNNVSNSIATPTTSPTLSPAQAEVAGGSLNLTDFDVEKELDELNLKKPLQQEKIHEINDVKDSKSVNTLQLSPGKNINSQLSFEDLSLEPTSKTVLNSIAARLTANPGPELNEQYLKDIEGYESSCSRHSNESAFEKEYETFINKITSESSGASKKAEQKSPETAKEIDFDKNVQDFSKFYKRKRKLKEDELNTNTIVNQSRKKLKTVEATKTNHSNFPQVYTKKSRNRLFKSKQQQHHKRKPLSFFYKLIYSMRRHQGLERGKRVRDFMLELKDKHLPLIKRQSIKNYTPQVNGNMLVPKTLKALCIMVFNTEEFRQSLALAKDQQQDNSLELEEKHICTDPTCETCEVIKSLMETENFEATLLQQATESDTVYCAEAAKAAITLLDDMPDAKDLNFRNAEPIVFADTIENSQYIHENLSELITDSVLSENLVLEEQGDAFERMKEQNIYANDPAEIVLQTAFGNFETSFPETDEAETEAQDVVSQIEGLTSIETNIVLQTIDGLQLDPIHPVAEAPSHDNLELINFSDKSSVCCGLSLSGQQDKSVGEAVAEAAHTLQDQKLSVSGKSAESETTKVKNNLNETSAVEANISPSLKDEKHSETKTNEESDTGDLVSSDSESASSSSDTEDSSTADSYKRRSSSNESSCTDTENDLEEHETCNVNATQSVGDDKMQSSNAVTQKAESTVSEQTAELNSCSAQLQTVVNTKTVLDHEKVPSSPQRIVIRITKSFSPHEQSLRVENISAKPLKEVDTEADHDADDEDIKEEKTDLLSMQQEDFVYKNSVGKRTDGSHAEDCGTEKKLVTPLKLVLRGKEYLSVKTVKRSLRLQTEHDMSTDSESENEVYLKKKSKGKIKKHEKGKYIKKSKLKDQNTSENNPEGSLEEIDCKDEDEANLGNFETSEDKENTMDAEVSKIFEFRDEKQQKENEEFVDITLVKKSDSRPEIVAKNILTSEELNQFSEEQEKDYLFGDIFENQTHPFALNSALQSPKQDRFNEDVSELDFLQDIEVEKATSFAVLSENPDDVVSGSLKKTSSLEVIETYSLTDSEAETEIHSLSVSESYNECEYDTYEDEEPLEVTNSSIVISDDESLEGAAENAQSSIKIFTDRKRNTEPNDAKFCHKAILFENKECLEISQYDATKDNSEYSETPLESHHTNVADFVDTTKTDVSCSEQDISDCSFSDEDTSSTSNSQKAAEEDGLFLDSEANESHTKALCAQPDEPRPVEDFATDLPKDRQPTTDFNSEEEKREILSLSNEKQTVEAKPLVEEDLDFEASEKSTNQSRYHQTKSEKGNQSIADDTKGTTREHLLTANELTCQEDYKICTPEACSPAKEELRTTPPEICKEIVQTFSEEEIGIDISEENNSELAKSENTHAKTDSLENSEESITQSDSEICSSSTCSPIPEGSSCTSRAVFEETMSGKINLSTKTKAAYKAYDLQNVAKVEYLSDSETEKLCSNSQQSKVDLSGITEVHKTEKPIAIKAHKSPLSDVISDHDIKHSPEESKSSRSKSVQLANLDAESEKFDIVEDIESPASEERSANEPPNEVAEIRALEESTGTTMVAGAITTSEETESRCLTSVDMISLCCRNISIENFDENPKVVEDKKLPEVSENNGDANISSPEMQVEVYKSFLVDSNSDEKVEENSENSATAKCIDTHTIQTNALGQCSLLQSKVSVEVSNRPFITETEGKDFHINSECEKSDDPEGSKTPQMEINSSEVIKTGSSAGRPETTKKAQIQEKLESLDELLENVSESTVEELEDHRLTPCNGKPIVEEYFDVKKGEEERRDELSETPGKICELTLNSDVGQPADDLKEGKITETVLENMEIISLTSKPAEEVKSHAIEGNLIGGVEMASQDAKFKVEKIEEHERNVLNENSIPTYKSCQAAEAGQISKDTSSDDNIEEVIGDKEDNEENDSTADSAEKTEGSKFKDSSTATIKDDNIVEAIEEKEADEENDSTVESAEKTEGSKFKEISTATIKDDDIVKAIVEKEANEENDSTTESAENTEGSNFKESSTATIKDDNIVEAIEEKEVDEENDSTVELAENTEGSHFKESSTGTIKDDNIVEAIEEKETNEENDSTAESAEEIEKSDSKERSIESIKKDLIFEQDENPRKEMSIDQGTKEPSEEVNKFEETNFKEISMKADDFGETNKEESIKVLREDGNGNSISMDSSVESEGGHLRESPAQLESSTITPELYRLSEGSHTEEINKDSSEEEKADAEKITERKDVKENCIRSKEKQSLFEIQHVPKDVAKVDDKAENSAREKVTSAIAKPEITTKDHDLKKYLTSNKELDIAAEVIQLRDGSINEEETVSEINLKPNKEEGLHESLMQELQEETLGVVSTNQDSDMSNDVVNEKNNEEEGNIEREHHCVTDNDVKISDKFEKPQSSEESLTNDHQTEEPKLEPQKEDSNGTGGAKTLSKPCATPDELSADFFGFKNQSSFEDESEDFHGFEDLEEVTRIRQEIENLNDDSAANDGFFSNISLKRAIPSTSTASLTESTTSEMNEMEALEKELSQHQLELEVVDEDRETEKEYQIKTAKVVSSNDIEHIKQMLESDEEAQNDGEHKLETVAHTTKDKSVENNINILNDRLSSIIPKLSDLCRAALNSSLNSSSNLAQQQIESPTILVDRELSVEEALAEMYRQAGVLLSDSEDCDNEVPPSNDAEAHDVLLINLQEILNSDNNDVYVLQCDMNENVLHEEHEEQSLQIEGVNTEGVNTVQIIVDADNDGPQIHIISSDSESEVIILSDDDSEIGFRRLRAREEHIAIPFINDEELIKDDDDDDSLFDISTIHHEEIVPDNLTKFLRDEFYKYLHEKYVQRSISKYYHAHKVLKKYKRRFIRRQ